MAQIVRLSISTYFYVENKSCRYVELLYEQSRVSCIFCLWDLKAETKTGRWLKSFTVTALLEGSENGSRLSRWCSRWFSRWISRCSGGETHSGVSWGFGQCHTEECRQVAEPLESIKRGGKQSQRRHKREESQVGALAERPRPTSRRRNNLAASRETSRETSRVFELMIKWAAGERGGSCSIRDPLQGTKPQNRTTKVPTRTVFTADTGLYCTCDVL